MNKLNNIIIAFLLGISASFAADVYMLDDCLRIARENNATLKSAKVNRQMAEETEGSAFPAYFPKGSLVVLPLSQTISWSNRKWTCPKKWKVSESK